MEEIPEIVPNSSGPFSFYKLEKTGWTTPDALMRIRREWNIEARRLSYGGLKDRHAQTTQYFTIHGGPNRSLNLPGIRVQFSGFYKEPYGATHFNANQFHLILRNISGIQKEKLAEICQILPQAGVPNYFDDQRFGSINHLQDGFIGKHMVLGNFEEALKLALTLHYAHDKADIRHEKKHLQDHWGNWPECKDGLGKCHSRSIIDYLVHHPQGFKAAAERLRPELSGLYLSAYQSHIWNLVLAEWIRSKLPKEKTYPLKLKLDQFPAPKERMPLGSHAMERIPLPSVRLKIDPDHPFHNLIQEVLSQEGLTLEKMKVSGSRKLFFSRGERLAFYFPEDFKAQTHEDELHHGKTALKMSFRLPKGSYATLLIKSVQSLLKLHQVGERS